MKMAKLLELGTWQDLWLKRQATDQYDYMRKAMQDARLPYKKSKYGYYIFRDLLQPVRGALNLAFAALFFALAPLAFLAYTIASLFPQFRKGRSFVQTMKESAIRVAGLYLKGALAHAIRGSAQVLLSVPALLIGVPYRLFLTGKHGTRSVLDNPKTKDMLNELEVEAAKPDADRVKLYNSTQVLLNKVIKAINRGQQSKDELTNVKDAIIESGPFRIPAENAKQTLERIEKVRETITNLTTTPQQRALLKSLKGLAESSQKLAEGITGFKVREDKEEQDPVARFAKSADGVWLCDINVPKVPAFVALFKQAVAVRETEVAARNTKVAAPR